MAKPLNFKINNNIYDLEPLKLDRKKLYGWSEKIVLDDQENKCDTLTLYPDLAMIIPKGGVGLGSLSQSGQWVEKSDIVHVNKDGTPATLVPSSFDKEIELNNSVPIEVFLEHNITAVYSLQGEENHPNFVKAIQDNKEIFTFEFNYRAGYEGDPAFLLENNGEVFVLVGKKIEFEFCGLDESGILDEEEDDEFEDDEFDFSMM